MLDFFEHLITSQDMHTIRLGCMEAERSLLVEKGSTGLCNSMSTDRSWVLNVVAMNSRTSLI